MQKLGVFWKIQDICYIMGTEIFKIEEEMTEKMKPKVANPPSKNEQNSLQFMHEFSKTPPTFAFWMSLKVVMAVFPQNDIFLGHPVN